VTSFFNSTALGCYLRIDKDIRSMGMGIVFDLRGGHDPVKEEKDNAVQ